jgi:crossover junction endonuclease EME1
VRVEGTYLLYYSAAELIENIDRLRQIFTTIRARLHLSSKHQIFLMVDGLRRYCKSKRNVKMEGIERALAGIQVAERCFIIHTDGVTETVDWFYDLSADIGIKPHKYFLLLPPPKLRCVLTNLFPK